jgi:mRNA-degrading endonuclease RelE of RelBE toxin-antitoxin system
MPTIRFDDLFSKSAHKFTRNNLQKAKAVKKALRLFRENTKYPSLHVEKLSGSNIWTIRVDRGNRLFFMWADEEDTAIFFFVGYHDAYRTVSK